MNYLRVPSEVQINDICKKDFSWSAGMYRKVIIPTPKVKPLKDLLDKNKPFDKGNEPGSMWYMKKSTCYFIRTKALQDHSNLLYPKGDSIIPVNPKIFVNPKLVSGDILLSKDSNIGECAIVSQEYCNNYMFSSGMVRIHPKQDNLYLFAFMKHPIFKTQLKSMVPRGATITHAKTLWLDCLIPFPNQKDDKQIVEYVSALMQAIIDKEEAIKERAEKIHNIIQLELIGNQKNNKFKFSYPNYNELLQSYRLDSAIYDNEYKSKIWLVENYKGDYAIPSDYGFTVIPGPSLEIKLLKTRIDSDVYKPGFYALILPTNISAYGTMNVIPYLGTAKKLPLLKEGDIIFGEAGFHKGRSIVLLEGINNCTTNAHGLYARRSDGDIKKSIYFRCIFDWYRSKRLIDLMAVGGSGGHFSPEYFDYIKIPKFPQNKQDEIVLQYHNPTPKPSEKLTIRDLVNWHKKWNNGLGIWELDREMKVLQNTLLDVQQKIIDGKVVKVEL